MQSPPLLDIPSLVVRDHPRTQNQRQNTPKPAKGGRRRQRWDILRSILIPEDITTHHTHEIRHRHSDTRQHHTTVLVSDVVIVPDIENYAGSGRAPGHCIHRIISDSPSDESCLGGRQESGVWRTLAVQRSRAIMPEHMRQEKLTHETCEVSNVKFSFDIDGDVDDEANESEEKAEGNEREAEAGEVRSESQD
jgi:hypothetical protein